MLWLFLTFSVIWGSFEKSQFRLLQLSLTPSLPPTHKQTHTHRPATIWHKIRMGVGKNLNIWKKNLNLSTKIALLQRNIYKIERKRNLNSLNFMIQSYWVAGLLTHTKWGTKRKSFLVPLAANWLWKKSKFFQIPKKSTWWLMKDTCLKRKFLPHWPGLLKNPEVWHLGLTMASELSFKSKTVLEKKSQEEPKIVYQLYIKYN